jgi:hypothetical protein
VFRTARACLRIIALLALTSGFAKGAADPQPRSVIVNVYDRHGSAISDLSTEDFHVFLGGKPVAVLDAHYSTRPRRIVILMDMSVSMTAEDAEWNIAREAVLAVLAQTPKDVPIAMATFAEDIRNEIHFFSKPRVHLRVAERPGQEACPQVPKEERSL